nr:hypothetical protein [Tanacetum cinerariifolium]
AVVPAAPSFAADASVSAATTLEVSAAASLSADTPTAHDLLSTPLLCLHIHLHADHPIPIDVDRTALDRVQWVKQHVQLEPSMPTPLAVWQTRPPVWHEVSLLSPRRADSHKDSSVCALA